MAKGGKRKGAGRPKGAITNVKSRVTAEQILGGIDEQEAWKWALSTARQKKDVKTYADILKYLTDRRDGKPKQAIDLGNRDGKPFEIAVRNVGPKLRPESAGGNGSPAEAGASPLVRRGEQ